MNDSLNNKELVAVGHQFAKAMSSDTPIIDMAKIVSRLAERLDCTTAALREVTKQRDALAAENAALASLTAEPVAYADPNAFRNFQAGAARRDWMWRNPGEDLIPLYTAPPAPVVPDIGEIRVGRLPTMNQEDYPGLGDWWVQLRICEDSDEVLARVYGATPQEANSRAEALACRDAMLQGAEPVKSGLTLRDGVAVVRNSGIAIDAGKIQAERDALNSPAIPDGYALVPVEPTEGMMAAAMNSDDVLFDTEDDTMFRVQHGVIWRAMLVAAPQLGG